MLEESATTRPPSNSEIFIRQHANDYVHFQEQISGFPDAKIDVFIPLSELSKDAKKSNESWYQNAVQEAYTINGEIFEKLPEYSQVIFLSSTDEFNQCIPSQWRKKRKGDRMKGIFFDGKVLLFIPPTLTTETDFKPPPESPEMIKTIMNHEVCHATIENLYKDKNFQSLPSWVSEGASMTVTTDFSNNAKYRKKKSSLLEALDRSPIKPPTAEYYRETTISGSPTPIEYDFGRQFFVWLCETQKPNLPEVEQKKYLKVFLDAGFTTTDFDIQAACMATLGKSYQDAYEEFIRFLRGLN